MPHADAISLYKILQHTLKEVEKAFDEATAASKPDA
jgi:hypothetical protein